MITKAEIAALWLAACPSFAPAYEESCAAYEDDRLYTHAGAFARHLLRLHRSARREEFPAVAGFIERLHTEGDPYTREFATIGILEGIQNVWSHTDVSPEEFLPFLQPVSAASWHCLNQFWAGQIPSVPDPTRDIPL